MICFNSDFLKELILFWFSKGVPSTSNSHLIFAITTFVVSLILVLLNGILIKTKGRDLLKLQIISINEDNEDEENCDKDEKGYKNNNNYDWRKIYIPFLWVIGSFLISFILTTTEIVNIKIISSIVVGFTWDKLFVQLSKMNNQDEVGVNVNKIELKDEE